MKLRSLLHRRHADQLPIYPAIEPDDPVAGRTGGQSARGFPYTAHALEQEERLERLITPSELDLVREDRA